MTEPRTEAGRSHLKWLLAGDDVFEEDARAAVLAIEEEAADAAPAGLDAQDVRSHEAYEQGRVDALAAAAGLDVATEQLVRAATAYRNSGRAANGRWLDTALAEYARLAGSAAE